MSYNVLHYRGDKVKNFKPGMIMGPDFATRRIFEVIDAEFDGERTTVNLQSPPSREALQAAGLIN